MDLAPLRSMVREIQFGTFGVPAIVSVPGQPNVSTNIVWLTPVSDDRPTGAEFARLEVRRSMAIRRDGVPSVPLGTTIAVTEHLLTSPSLWVVDGMDAIFQDHHRVVVRPQA